MQCRFETNQMNCIYLNEKCLKYAEKEWTLFQRLFPKTFLSEFNKKQRTVFVYESEREKPLYIFSNRSNPFLMSTIRLITSKQAQSTWFLKSITKNNNYRFYGAFNWKANQIYLLASSKQKSLFLIELLDSKQFRVSTEVTINN